WLKSRGTRATATPMVKFRCCRWPARQSWRLTQAATGDGRDSGHCRTGNLGRAGPRLSRHAASKERGMARIGANASQRLALTVSGDGMADESVTVATALHIVKLVDR